MYDKFNKDEINELSKLNFTFSLSERFVYAKNNEGEYFQSDTPFLKILKPIHTTLNKKKTIAKKYIILETNDDLDFNNQIGEFMFVINKIHEISQEKIREKSLQWFNTEFDDIGLDIKVRKPIDQQKDNEFIRISIPKNSDIETKINNLEKGNYISCNIIFKGLKISSDLITEEWELKDFITQDNYEAVHNEEYENEIIINKLLEETKENIEENNEEVKEEVKEEINEEVKDETNDEPNKEYNIVIDKSLIRHKKTININKKKIGKEYIDPIKKYSKKLIFT